MNWKRNIEQDRIESDFTVFDKPAYIITKGLHKLTDKGFGWMLYRLGVDMNYKIVEPPKRIRVNKIDLAMFKTLKEAKAFAETEHNGN